MALEGSHILFAKEFAQDLNVSDFEAYYSGTIYPDSRYVTDIQRELTHPIGYKITQELDDFTKGWYIHLRADEIQYELFQHVFPKDLQTEQNTQWWYRLTAIKIIQDALLFNQFPYHDELQKITYHANPVGEDIKKVQKYNDLVRKFYLKFEKIQFDDYQEFWSTFDPQNRHLTPIFNEVHRIIKYENIEPNLLDLYERIIIEVKNSL